MSHLCLNKASTAELLLAITEIIFHTVHSGGREKLYNKSLPRSRAYYLVQLISATYKRIQVITDTHYNS